MTVGVRRAIPTDAPALVALRTTQMRERGAAFEDPDFSSRLEQWLFGAGDMRIHWLAECGHDPVGFVSLTEYERMPFPAGDAGRWGYVGNFYVLPDLRNRGIGTHLLKNVIAYADKLGFTRLVLSPSERSQPFYARAGFQAADILRVLPLSPKQSVGQ